MKAYVVHKGHEIEFERSILTPKLRIDGVEQPQKTTLTFNSDTVTGTAKDADGQTHEISVKINYGILDKVSFYFDGELIAIKQLL